MVYHHILDIYNLNQDYYFRGLSNQEIVSMVNLLIEVDKYVLCSEILKGKNYDL